MTTASATKALICTNLKRRAERAEKDFPSSEGGFKSGLKSAMATVNATRVDDDRS